MATHFTEYPVIKHEYKDKNTNRYFRAICLLETIYFADENAY